MINIKAVVNRMNIFSVRRFGSHSTSFSMVDTLLW